MKRLISAMFVLAALYDGLFGLVGLFFGGALFGWFGVPPPNHWGYVQFPGALLVVFAIMFAAVAADPVRNRNLIPYGILLKVSYCGVVLFYWLTSDVPFMWKPFCVADLVFLFLFAWAWSALRVPSPRAAR